MLWSFTANNSELTPHTCAHSYTAFWGHNSVQEASAALSTTLEPCYARYCLFLPFCFGRQDNNAVIRVISTSLPTACSKMSPFLVNCSIIVFVRFSLTNTFAGSTNQALLVILTCASFLGGATDDTNGVLHQDMDDSYLHSWLNALFHSVFVADQCLNRNLWSEAGSAINASVIALY